ncbi:MAG: hypothetical protein JWR62_599 [Modestobacter sp.]|nr:hypothetical protein [Modestobacter sp.]
MRGDEDGPMPSWISDDIAETCRESAAVAEAELRSLLDELHGRPVTMTNGLGQPSDGWAWLARGGRSA